MNYFKPKISQIKEERSKKFHKYLREFEYATVRTMFDLIYEKEADSIDLATMLELMVLLNFENQITEKINFEVKLLEDIIKVRFISLSK